MNNQNIYSGYVFINREVISKLGLNEKPFLRTVYLLMVERANYKTGIVMFSKRFAQSALCIGAKRYYSLLSEMEEMGLIEKQVTGKGKSSMFSVVHYFQVIEKTKVEKKEK